MMSILLMIFVVIVTFFFGDSVLTPLLLLLWKKTGLLLLKVQTLFTKKHLFQALVQSSLLAGKAMLRLINKTITVWVLPLLMTRRQRYWLHQALIDARKHLRRRALRAWIRWRRQPLWIKALTLVPATLLAAVVFIGSGILLAAVFGVSFIVPWIGGLPLATMVFFRHILARFALFVLERLGVGPIVNKMVDWAIDQIWWKTPASVQRRFDAWWRRLNTRLRRRVIGPRRQVTRRMARRQPGKLAGSGETRRSPRTPAPDADTDSGPSTSRIDQDADAQPTAIEPASSVAQDQKHKA